MYQCHNCLYRHSSCDCVEEHIETGNKCKSFRAGKCLSCKYWIIAHIYKEDELITNSWFRRGCETWCNSGCNKRKRLSRSKKKKLKKLGLL